MCELGRKEKSTLIGYRSTPASSNVTILQHSMSGKESCTRWEFMNEKKYPQNHDRDQKQVLRKKSKTQKRFGAKRKKTDYPSIYQKRANFTNLLFLNSHL